MGYESYVTGNYTIRPDLPPHVIDALDLGESGASELVAESGGEPETLGLVDGQIAVIPGNSWTEITCRIDERYRAENLGETVEVLAKAAAKAGCVMNGSLYLDGDNSDDFSRIRVEDNQVLHEQPELVWPNGDKGWG
jgi:hypothetical protein